MDIKLEYHKDKSQLYKGSIPGPILELILIEFQLRSRNISASIPGNIDSGVDSWLKIDAGIDARIDVRIDVDSQPWLPLIPEM
jgi:hypothetical protein